MIDRARHWFRIRRARQQIANDHEAALEQYAAVIRFYAPDGTEVSEAEFERQKVELVAKRLIALMEGDRYPPLLRWQIEDGDANRIRLHGMGVRA